MSTKSDAVASDDRPHSDLGRIKGLGPKSAKALPALGIGNCAELAQYLMQHSAQELSDRLAEQKVSVAAKTIENEDWLGQAREQAVQAEGEPATLKEEERGTGEEDETPNRRSGLPNEVRFGVIFWRENGHWKVTTYDERLPIEYDKQHGTDPAEWANWILSEMKPHLKVKPIPNESRTAAASDLEIEILDVRLSEVERFRKLAAELSFRVSGSMVDALAADRIPFWLHVHIVNLRNEEADCVALLREELEPAASTYKKKLEFPIPEVGRYELHNLVLLLSPVGRVAYRQGPILEVRP